MGRDPTRDDALREEFRLDPGLVYLNSGTHSIAPRAVIEAVQRHTEEYERNPTESLLNAWSRLWRVQERLGSFLGADPRDLFLGQNVTLPLNALILGLPLPEGRDEIVMSDAEYPAIANVARFRGERDGLAVRTFPVPGRKAELAGLTGEALAEAVVHRIGPRTGLVVLSHVLCGNGLALPISTIARGVRDRGALLVVDGAHATGALPLDFVDFEDVAAYAGNLHKWVLGPKGTAYGWVNRRHQEEIRAPWAGWTTYESSYPFDCFGGGSRFAARFLMSACQDFTPFFALDETFDFWARHGAERIRGRLRALLAHARAVADRRLGWECCSPRSELQGPLLAYELPEAIQREGMGFMARVLRERQVQIVTSKHQGRFVLRLSPHVYNTEDEVERAVDAVAELASRAPGPAAEAPWPR